ncbi:MAG: hypothetical protein KBD25_01490 [Rickettsiaceae bacterium]|nr:hypothetical protein [Rickettsiaceae bacterium]
MAILESKVLEFLKEYCNPKYIARLNITKIADILQKKGINSLGMLSLGLDEHDFLKGEHARKNLAALWASVDYLEEIRSGYRNNRKVASPTVVL